MDVVVFGAGSLGSLVGGVLAREQGGADRREGPPSERTGNGVTRDRAGADRREGPANERTGNEVTREHDVTLVGRDPHVSTVAADGLRVSGAFEFVAEPRATTTVPPTADLAVVTVKAYDTAEAAAALSDCDLERCLSLQNGMGNEATLAERLDCDVLAGTCTYGARLAEPGHVECTGVGEVTLGPRAGGRSEAADVVGDAFDAAGIETTVSDDMPRRLWEKLAVNAGINPVTALARTENGALVDGPAGDVAAAAARETARVASDQAGPDQVEGPASRGAGSEVTGDRDTDLSTERAVELVESVATDTAANRSSMLQDVESVSRTEVDAINGYVVDAADVPVPVNETLAGLIRAWERARNLREDR